MTRVSNTPTTHRRRKKIITLSKGFVGSKSKLFKAAKEQLMRSWAYAYRDRKIRKLGFSYSRFIHLLKLRHVNINRYHLSVNMLKVNPRFETKEHYYNVLGINRYLLETNAKHGDVRDLFFYVYKNNIRNNIGKESFRTKLVIEAYCVISCSKLRELYNSFLVKKEIDKFQTFLSYQFSSFLECSDEAFKLIEKDEQVCVRLQEKVFKTALSLNIEKKENFFLICLQEEILDLFKLFKSKMMEVFHERQINRRSTFVDADNEFGKAAFLHVTLAAYRVFISLQSKKNVSDIEIIRELNELRIFSEKCLSSSFVTSIIDSFYWEFLSRRSNLGFNINEELTLFNDNLFPWKQFVEKKRIKRLILADNLDGLTYEKGWKKSCEFIISWKRMQDEEINRNRLIITAILILIFGVIIALITWLDLSNVNNSGKRKKKTKKK